MSCHGYWQYCSLGSCVVCQTPWPKTWKTPSQRVLETRGYHQKYLKAEWGGMIPAGLFGSELLELEAETREDYKKLMAGVDPMEECRRRGGIGGLFGQGRGLTLANPSQNRGMDKQTKKLEEQFIVEQFLGAHQVFARDPLEFIDKDRDKVDDRVDDEVDEI